MTKKCKTCGKEFESTAPNQQYCCLECRAYSDRIKRLTWEHLHPDYGKEYRSRRKELIRER